PSDEGERRVPPEVGLPEDGVQRREHRGREDGDRAFRGAKLERALGTREQDHHREPGECDPDPDGWKPTDSLLQKRHRKNRDECGRRGAGVIGHKATPQNGTRRTIEPWTAQFRSSRSWTATSAEAGAAIKT